MTDDPGALATSYFQSWQSKDFDTLGSILADDVSFHGPLATLHGAEECLRGLRQLAELITDLDIRKMWVDGPDVLTWFDLHTALAPPCPTVNWSHVEDGKIAAIRVTFDPRPLLSAG